MIKANELGYSDTKGKVSAKLAGLLPLLEYLSMHSNGELTDEISSLRKKLIFGIRKQGDVCELVDNKWRVKLK
jgi:hypothetical protein